MAQGLGTPGLEGGLQNGACISVLVVGQAPPNGYQQHLCPQEVYQLLSASLGGSPKSANGSEPGSFEIPASQPSLGVCEILCVPFKSRVFVSYSPLALLCKLHWPSKPDVLGTRFPGAGPQAGEPNLRLGSLTPWGELLQL